MAVFKSTVFKSTVFDTGSITPEEVISAGGFDLNYRRHLERLEKITRTKDLTRKEIQAAQEVVENAPDQAVIPEIEKLARADAVIDEIAIDYEAIRGEVVRLMALMDAMNEFLSIQNKMTMDELDDELALLLMIN